MKPILTFTANPAIDGFCEAEAVRPIHKIRTTNEVFRPGGGGVNVARVIHELGGPVEALYLAGGVTGAVLDELVAGLGIPHRRVRVAEDTRIAQVVFERSTGLEYRFVPEGPHVAEAEWRAALDAVAASEAEWLVLSGSLPPGVPVTFFAEAAERARARGTQVALDTSGPALAASLARGGLDLVKPSRGEFEALVGRRLENRAALADAALSYVAGGRTKRLVVTLGADGAVLATSAGIVELASPPVVAKSAVGAGDSFVAAMVLALARGAADREAFAYGVAAGAAAVLHHGAHLCDPADVERLFAGLMQAGASAPPLTSGG